MVKRSAHLWLFSKRSTSALAICFLMMFYSSESRFYSTVSQLLNHFEYVVSIFLSVLLFPILEQEVLQVGCKICKSHICPFHMRQPTKSNGLRCPEQMLPHHQNYNWIYCYTCSSRIVNFNSSLLIDQLIASPQCSSLSHISWSQCSLHEYSPSWICILLSQPFIVFLGWIL